MYIICALTVRARRTSILVVSLPSPVVGIAPRASQFFLWVRVHVLPINSNEKAHHAVNNFPRVFSFIAITITYNAALSYRHPPLDMI